MTEAKLNNQKGELNLNISLQMCQESVPSLTELNNTQQQESQQWCHRRVKTKLNSKNTELNMCPHQKLCPVTEMHRA